MTSTNLFFIKKKFANIAAAQELSTTKPGSVVFDKAHKVLCVDGDVYSGSISDVSLANGILTITKTDGTTQTLNFTNINTASGNLPAFAQLKTLLGLTSGEETSLAGTWSTQGGILNTAGTNAGDFRKAVDTLDSELSEHTDKSNEGTTIKHTAQGISVTPYTDGDVTLTGTDMQAAYEEVVQKVIDNEEVTERAIEAIQNGVGLNANLEYVTKTNTNFLNDTDSVDSALIALDTAIQGVRTTAATYEIAEQATAETGAFKTYVLNKTQNGSTSQAGVKINIPKDFLVKSGSVKTVETIDVPYTGAKVGDKYLDFVVNSKEGTATDEHIYIPVKDLVDVYTAQQNATEVQLAIDSNNEISATIVNGAVTTEKIAAQGVTGAKIADKSIEARHLADNLVVQGSNGTPAEVITNDTNPTTIATIGNTPIQVKTGLYWDEWSSAEPAQN